MPLDTPTQPWNGVTMAFVTDCPESKASGYTGILGIVDQLTQTAMYLPCWKDNDCPELRTIFFEQDMCKRGVPDNIVTDRGTQFQSQSCTRVCSDLSTGLRLSTAFHPQRNAQTECPSWPMEQYLRAFYNYEQDNWVQLLPLAEFTYNDMLHGSMWMTPFWANYHCHPVM